MTQVPPSSLVEMSKVQRIMSASNRPMVVGF